MEPHPVRSPRRPRRSRDVAAQSTKLWGWCVWGSTWTLGYFIGVVGERASRGTLSGRGRDETRPDRWSVRQESVKGLNFRYRTQRLKSHASGPSNLVCFGGAAPLHEQMSKVAIHTRGQQWSPEFFRTGN